MKSILRILPIALLILVSIGLQAQMRQVYVDNTQINDNISKISFVSPGTGFVAFAKWIGFTTDSGRTFARRYITASNVNFNGYSVNLTFGFGIGGVKAFSKDTILAYGNYGFVPAILYSVDGGNSYTLIYQSQINFQRLTVGIIDMVFPQNTGTGYAVEPDRIIKTTDRGKTWTPVLNSPSSFYNFLEGVDDNTLFAFNDSKLVKTTNGGATWQQLTLPGLTLNYAAFVSPANGWIDMQDNGGVYYTKDGGASWQQKTISGLTSLYTNKMHFVNDSTGYATGDQYTTNKTSDSGKTWQALPRDNGYSYLNYTHTDLFFLSASQFWAGGGQGFLELSTNGGGRPLPRALFLIDTVGESVAQTVKLDNYSKAGYQYQWFRNDTLFSTAYSPSYTHDVYRSADTIMLIVSDGAHNDTSIRYQKFTAIPRPTPPVLSSFSPQSAGVGVTLTLKGKNFTGTTSVTLGGTAVQSFTVVSDSVMTVIVGTGASGAVAVTNKYGTASLAGFTFTTQLSILSFSPQSATVGSTITITGTNFSPTASGNIVYIGGIQTPVITASSGTLTVKAPAGASLLPVSVTVAGLTATSTQPFQYASAKPDSITIATFPSEISLSVPVNAGGVAVADFDGDGKPDIVTCNQDAATGTLPALLNTSTADSVSFKLQPAAATNAGSGGFNAIQAGDIDGDGKIDAVILDGVGFGIFKNTSTSGAISFAPMVDISWGYSTTGGQFAMADLDGDGKPDLVSGTIFTNKVYHNTSSNGKFSFENLPDYTIPPYLGYYVNNGNCILMDVDGDGKPDAVVETVKGIYVFLNTSVPGTISFAKGVFVPLATTGAGPGQYATGDLDGDGKTDFVMYTSYNTMGILRNLSTPGNVSFAAPTYLGATGGDPAMRLNNFYNMQIGDLNGDGKPEIVASAYLPYVLAGRNPQVFLWQNNSVPGSIAFDPQVTLAYDSTSHFDYSVTLADFNGDGVQDIGVASLQHLPAMAILLNQSSVGVELCAGGTTTLKATRTGAAYQWRMNVNGAFQPLANDVHYSGVNSASLQIAAVPAAWAGNQYECWVGGRADRVFRLVIDSAVSPSVAIVSADTVICAGATANFRAQAVNGGTIPAYQWQVNGVGVPGSGAAFSSSSLRDKDSVTVRLTSNAACAAPAAVLSPAKYMAVKQNLPVSVSVIASDTTVCAGAPVIFSAKAVNPGSQPLYDWKKNGASTGGKDSVYLNSSLANGDLITVTLTSSAACTVSPMATSNAITMIVHQPVTPAVTIAGTTSVSRGQSASIKASTRNGGAHPSLQWQDSTQTHGWQIIANAADSQLSYQPAATGDRIRAILRSGEACVTRVGDTSNVLVFTVSGGAITPGDSTGIRYYPNPARDILTVDGLKPADGWVAIEVVSFTGQRVIRLDNIAGQSKVLLHVQGLARGLYIVKLETASGRGPHFAFFKTN